MSETFFTKKTSIEAAGNLVRNEKAQEKTSNKEFDLSSVEVIDGLVNLTRLAKSQGKDVKLWVRLKSTKEFLSAFEQVNQGVQNMHTIIGKDKEQGTFAVREIAIELARWISPKFAVWTNKQIDTLFQTGKVELAPEPKPKELTKLEWIKLALETEEARERERLEKEQIKLELTQTKTELDHKQAIVMERVATVPAQEIRTKLNKICRWTKQGDFQYRWRLLYKEFYYTHHKNLKELADNAEMKILDYAEKFGYLENLYNLALKLFETEREGELLLLN